MRLDLLGRNQFVAQRLGERDVDQLIAVDVADLALTEAPLGAPEAVRAGFDARPAADDRVDLVISQGLANRLENFADDFAPIATCSCKRLHQHLVTIRIQVLK